jgi:CDP-diacylglycerol--inositol 3-phosphatidyltransferase
MPLHPRTCSLLYSFSCLLDALDGIAARHFNQATRFGAVLDMVTDRCTTSCLLVFLSSAWPRWSLLFQGLISLDVASHYIHMYATLTMGSAGQSHKKVDQTRSRILNLYYSDNVSEIIVSPAPHWLAPIQRNPHPYLSQSFGVVFPLLHLFAPTRPRLFLQLRITDLLSPLRNSFPPPQRVLFMLCALNELFFISLYLLSFSSPTLSPLLLKSAGNGAAASVSSAKPAPNVAQTLFVSPYSAGALELARANKIDSFWPWVLAGVSFPVMVAKQLINVLQLVKASKWLAQGDMAARIRHRQSPSTSVDVDKNL